jgi:WD40 repeat protein
LKPLHVNDTMRHDDDVTALGYDALNNTLVTGGADGMLNLYRADTITFMRAIACKGLGGSRICISRIIPSIDVASLGGGVDLLVILPPPITKERTTIVALCCMRTISIWNASVGVCTLSFNAIEDSSDCVTALTCSPNGALLYAGTASGKVRVWELHASSYTLPVKGRSL